MQGPYGVPPGGGYGAPPPGGGYGGPPGPYGAGMGGPPGGVPGTPMMPGQMGVGYGYGQPIIQTPKNAGLAVMMELLGGFFFQTFGIGHIYAGRVGIGIAWMLGYWVVTAINFMLCFILVGFITWPLCWIAAMIISPITVNGAIKQENARMGLPGYG